MALLALFTALTVAIYIEEIVFVLKNFRKGTRKQKTIWILAFFPVKYPDNLFTYMFGNNLYA